MEIGAKRIDAANANPVQTAGYFVRIFIEFAARMQNGHDHFQCAFLLLRVDPGRNAPSVIHHLYRIIFVNGHQDVLAVAGQRFVDRIIHHLIDQVMKTLFADIPDIHGRSFPNGFQTFQNLYTVCAIAVGCRNQNFLG